MHRKQERTDDSGAGQRPEGNFYEKKTNYTPYIIGGVILLAILAAIIF